MQGYDAKSVALGAAANLLADGTATPKSAVSAAISFLVGMTDKATFIKKCAKCPQYAKLVLLTQQKPAEFDSDSFCALHKTLFEPRAKAGEFRTEELMLAGGSCTDSKLLRGSLKNALIKLSELRGAPETAKPDFAASLSCFARELIILSPFSYGNGVTRRAFIQSFALSRGFFLNYAAVSKKELEEAENLAFAADDPQQLITALVKCLNYITENTASKSKPNKLALSSRHVSALPPKSARSSVEIAAAKPAAPQPEPRRIPQREKPDSKAEALRELREIQKSLAALTQRVTDVIKSLAKE